MLRLSNLTARIEALEAEEYQSDSERLDTWQAMVTWQLWRIQQGDNWQEVYSSLPVTHPLRADIGSKLMWFVWKFSDLLPSQASVKWWYEKVELCFDCWLTEAIESGFSHADLSTYEAMNQCLEWIISNLKDMTWYDDLKAKEYQERENRLLFRRLAHEAALTPEAAEWLRQNDKDFLENMAMKNSTSVDVLLTQLMAKVSQPLKPLESDPERQARIAARIELMNAVPEVQTPPVSNGSVLVMFQGGMHGFSLNGQSVEYGSVIEVSASQFELMQSSYPAGWWIKVSG